VRSGSHSSALRLDAMPAEVRGISIREESMLDEKKLIAQQHRPSRRQIITSAAAALGWFVLAADHACAVGESEISHSAEAIHQEPVFKANPRKIYKVLTDAREFDKVVRQSVAMHSGMISGDPHTEISPVAGGEFSLFAGVIMGRQIELIPNQRIVQAWRDADWKPGVYSIAKFELVQEGSGTRIIFDHTGFPVGNAEHLAAGWKANYWEPLGKVLS
jgi:activator of HSP90 ATPase